MGRGQAQGKMGRKGVEGGCQGRARRLEDGRGRNLLEERQAGEEKSVCIL